MSTFDEASLVFIPSGYKTSKAYSVKPSDGSGDLAFTRSNDTATRVGPDGFIEKVRTNVALYSEQFNNAAWAIVGGSSVTANTTTAPDGTLTADTLTVATNNFSGLAQTFTTSTNAWTISLFVKKGTKDFLYLFDPTTTGRAHFNLTTGAVATTVSVTASMTAVGNGWFRCSVTRSITGAAGHYFQFGLSDTDNTILPTSAGTAFIWGAQAEVSDFGATSYIATTSAAVSVGPVANVPRLDYLGSTCGKLLLEPQRTNLALYSEQLNNAEYTADSASFTANATASPDGYTNADLLTENSSSATHGFYASIVARGTTGASLTTSIFAKANGRRYINISGGFDSGNYYNAVFDLQTGVVSTTGNGGAAGTPTASIVSYGNGWYRCIVTGSIAGLPNRLSFIYLTDATTGNGVGGRTYTGNGTSGAYFYGYQIETASYATSYIPTLGAAVTRGAEIANKTGISSLIGQTEGTLFVEANVKSGYDTDNMLLAISDGTDTNLIYINRSNGRAAFAVLNGGAVQLFYNQSTVLPAGVHKIAIAYKQNDFAIYLDGTLVHSSSSGSVPACSKVNIGSYSLDVAPYNDGIKQALLLKTRLSNDSLAALTA